MGLRTIFIRFVWVGAVGCAFYSTSSIASKTNSSSESECQRGAWDKWDDCYTTCVANSHDTSTPDKQCAIKCSEKFDELMIQCGREEVEKKTSEKPENTGH